jgi:hypothetical protein
VVTKLKIEITADPKAPTKGTLAIRWGSHARTAPIQLDLGLGRPEAVGKK